jgi:phenylacetate-CoA ligase
VSTDNLNEEKIALIKKEMEQYLEPDLEITFEKLKALNRTKGGKLKQFTSNLKNNH